MSDDELVGMVTINRDKYQKVAVEIAEAELSHRKIPTERFEAAKAAHQNQLNEQLAKARAPIHPGLIVLAFFLGPIATLIVSLFFRSNGYDRQANTLVKWTLFGILFYVLLAILINL